MKSNKEKERYNKMIKIIKSWNLSYTFAGIDFCVNREDTSLNQLRTELFISNTEEDLKYDEERAVKLLIMIGLIKDSNITEEEYKAIENKAFEYMEQWRKEIGHISILQILLIRTMEELHFFMGDQEVTDLIMLGNMKRDDLVLNKGLKSIIQERKKEESLQQKMDSVTQEMNSEKS